MPLEETLATFGYLIKELDAMKPAYIALLQYVTTLDVEFDGKSRATKHDIVAAYAPLIKNTKFILNGGLTPSVADGLIKSGSIDAAAFGIPWIAHPDMQKRFEAGKPLDAVTNWKDVYWHEGITVREGYTDYPSIIA
ncbi:hypothetical protein M422DRAFT_171451 [Sphaerobolus stellatus SS14]|uniref:NADH:flavin oxidoreductase/NADH oxidase N-terminal domain-containing protein n=1 Tax=Sphaerobolus stellatus (strain SS14) TaxID=990650 RepID=A0A0C9V5D4_SPHS4|nr:hypothetical protein M422DRAFT_171451 [Sphaerobolus stellatus SS14]